MDLAAHRINVPINHSVDDIISANDIMIKCDLTVGTHHGDELLDDFGV